MRADTVRFLMDMIGSEEVYLLDLSELPVKLYPLSRNSNTSRVRKRPKIHRQVANGGR